MLSEKNPSKDDDSCRPCMKRAMMHVCRPCGFLMPVSVFDRPMTRCLVPLTIFSTGRKYRLRKVGIPANSVSGSYIMKCRTRSHIESAFPLSRPLPPQNVLQNQARSQRSGSFSRAGSSIEQQTRRQSPMIPSCWFFKTALATQCPVAAMRSNISLRQGEG